MGYDRPDVYYQPEAFLLIPVAELNYADAYEFDIRAVWAHVDGRLFTARDSGCSCPSPFEDYISLDKLDELTPAFMAKLAEEALHQAHSEYRYVDELEVSIFLDKVQAALDRLRAEEVV